MRLNKFIALATGHSRRSADVLITAGKVHVNGVAATLGQTITDQDSVTLNGKPLRRAGIEFIALHKPVGYVCSRARQGNPTIYDLLPATYQHLKPIGRLDKNSSGLILLTNDGDTAHKFTHPSFKKEKIYIVTLDKPLHQSDKQKIEQGVNLDDGKSQLSLTKMKHQWIVTMSEGRNRQIRRTFAALGYDVIQLHRIQFGKFRLEDLPAGKYRQVTLK